MGNNKWMADEPIIGDIMFTDKRRNSDDFLIPVGPLFSHPPKRFTKEKYFCLSGEKCLGVKDLIFDL